MSTLRLFCLFILVSACNQKVYGPNFQHNPQLENRGDWQISGSRGGVPEFKSLDVSVAHAIYPDVGVMLNGQFTYDYLYAPSKQGFYLEPAIGIFNREHSWLKYSVYALYGIGRQINSAGRQQHTIHWNRYALQPAAEIDFGGSYLTLSARVGMISFDRGFSAWVLDNSLPPSQGTFTSSREFVLFEPAITFSYSFRPFLVSFQYVGQLPPYLHGAFAQHYLGGSIAWRILK